MPRRNQPTLSQDFKIGVGTLSNLDVEEGKADVTIPSSGVVYHGVPIFYHCAPDDIENGPKAFFDGASVLVADVESASERRIVGFSDGFPRPCTEPGAHYILQVLTHTSKPGPPIEFNSKGYLVGIAEEGCSFELLESERLLQPHIGSPYNTIVNLSQCKYSCAVAGEEYTDEVIGTGDGSALDPPLTTLLHFPVCEEEDELPIVTTLDAGDNLMTVNVSAEGVCSGDCTAGFLDMETGTWTTCISWTAAPKNEQDILISYHERDLREASLYHFDNVWLMGGFDRIVKVVNHGGAADFEARIQIIIPGGGVVDLIGALSSDLTELYISLYASLLFKPLTERQIEYFVFELAKGEYHEYSLPIGEIKGEWKLIRSGKTPAGMEYIDNIVTRNGLCGCWKDETETLEEYTMEETLEQSNCWGSGGSSYKSGKRLKLHFKTFSMHSEDFVVSEKMYGFHMSPFLKDYAVCEGYDVYSYDDGGTPLQNSEWNCVCACNACGYPMPSSSLFDRQVFHEIIALGWSEKFKLISGLKTIATNWGTFWSGYYHSYTNHFHVTQACPPAPGHPKGYATSDWLNSQGYQYLTHGYTTYVYRDVNDSESIWVMKGNCGWDGSSPGWIGGGFCHTIYSPWMCKPGVEVAWNCSEDVLIQPWVWTTVKERRLLSPFAITLRYDEVYGWESIENAFISYDKKTDSLIRGLKFWTYDAAHRKRWYWKILAKFPDCAERDITDELQSLLLPEEYTKLEAIIFVDKVT